MAKSKSHDHYANQRGMNQVMSKPSTSTVKKVGVTGPIQKPSPTTMKHVGVTGPGASTKGSKK